MKLSTPNATPLVERAVTEFSDSPDIQEGDVANHGMVGNVKVYRIHGNIAEVIDRNGKHLKLQLSSLHPGAVTEKVSPPVAENYDKHSAAAAQHDKFIQTGSTDTATYKAAIKHHERAAKTAPNDTLQNLHARKAEQYLIKSKTANEATVLELSIDTLQGVLRSEAHKQVKHLSDAGKQLRVTRSAREKIAQKQAEDILAAKGDSRVKTDIKEAGFPHDVDHMPGQTVRNAPMSTDDVRTADFARWDRAVDSINTKMFHDDCEYVTHGERKKIFNPAGEVFAIWDGVGQVGWFNSRGQRVRTVKENAVAESVMSAIKNVGKALAKPVISDKEVADYATAAQVVKRTKLDPAYKKRFTADPKGATSDVWKEATGVQEASQRFNVGDVVHVKWHSTSKPVNHGTTNIDKASATFAHAKHPESGDTIKVRQDTGAEAGASDVKGHFKFHKKVSEALDVAALQVGDPVRIIGNVQGAGEQGTFVDTGINGAFVVIKMDDGSKRSFHSSNVEYYDGDEGEDEYDEDDLGERVEEAHKLGDVVTITKGPKNTVGKTGHIGEIRHGAFKGANKTYTIDHEGGSIQLSKTQFTGEKGKKMVKESILREALVEAPGQGYGRERWDTNNQGYQDREQDRMDQSGRDFRRAEMDQELADEHNNYAVNIDGRQWKVFYDQRRANNVARSVMQKYPNKKVSVHATGAAVTEATQEDRKDTRTRALIADYEKRAKATTSDIKKRHLMAMATQLRDNLKLNETAKPKQQAVAPRNFVAKHSPSTGAGTHSNKKKAAQRGDVKHKGKQIDPE